MVEPKAGQAGILLFEPHVRALRGTPSSYEYTLLQQTYRVDILPRRGRNRKIIGVLAKVTVAPAPGAQTPKSSEALPTNTEQLRRMMKSRRRNSMKSVVRSLQLAKALADSARISAELRKSRAVEEQEKAEKARRRAEAEEQRARFLADASAMLDASIELPETLRRLGPLVVARIADWCVVHLGVEKLQRVAIHHRDAEKTGLLEKVFPESESKEADALSFNALRSAQPHVYSGLMRADLARLAPNPSRSAALKKLDVQSLLQTPIRTHGRTVGLLTAGFDEPGRWYDLDDLQMFQSLAHRIGIAHQSAVLFADAQREIAMRKEAEARLLAFNADLERRVRERTSLLEEATREANSFAYTVAHDLRAPLRAITGFCQALREDYSGKVDEVGQDYLDRIVSGSRRMDDLIRDLLDYARVNRAEIRRVPVNLDDVFDAVIESMSAELQERKAAVRRTSPLGRVMAHEPMLHQVVTNLLSNAVKFVAPGTTPDVSIESEVRDGRLRLRFRDNGIGVAPEHHSRIFGIFERLNRTEDYPGTGIGLAIVRRAVERLEGAVGLESKPRQGSTFWIELPTA